jgi:predicted deacylase
MIVFVGVVRRNCKRSQPPSTRASSSVTEDEASGLRAESRGAVRSVCSSNEWITNDLFASWLHQVADRFVERKTARKRSQGVIKSRHMTQVLLSAHCPTLLQVHDTHINRTFMVRRNCDLKIRFMCVS